MSPQIPEVPQQSIPEKETIDSPEKQTELPQVPEIENAPKESSAEKEIDLSSPIQGTSNQEITNEIANAEQQLEVSAVDPIKEVQILDKDINSGKAGPADIFNKWKQLDEKNKDNLGIHNE